MTDPRPQRTRNVLAYVLGGFITIAGVMHFASPGFFDDIVPPWLPPSERFWTYASGVVELAVGTMVLSPRTRRRGALAAIALFIGVYPANIYMAWDWRHRPVSEQLIAYGRLPFQFLFIWIAWRVARREDATA
ncbi:MAG: hypothetical protein F2789_13670 [Actinobacteria bacterium]|nr:hypothetical protein [Actinomycetota bacterium]